MDSLLSFFRLSSTLFGKFVERYCAVSMHRAFKMDNEKSERRHFYLLFRFFVFM